MNIEENLILIASDIAILRSKQQNGKKPRVTHFNKQLSVLQRDYNKGMKWLRWIGDIKAVERIERINQRAKPSINQYR